MPAHQSLNNDNLHGNWHLLVEMRARIIQINSTVILEYFIVVWLIFCCLLCIVISEVFGVLLVNESVVKYTTYINKTSVFSVII
jgi:hypothetical protein